jgi:hypothetical protein
MGVGGIAGGGEESQISVCSGVQEIPGGDVVKFVKDIRAMDRDWFYG